MAGSQRPESALGAWEGLRMETGVKLRPVELHTGRETGEVGAHGLMPPTNPTWALTCHKKQE